MDNDNHVDEVQSSEREHSDLGSLKYLKRIPLVDSYKSRIEWLWEHLKTQDYAFDDFIRGNHLAWLALLFDPTSEHYEFGDEGYLVVRSIIPKLDAHIHFAVWGKRPLGDIIAAGKEIMTDVFQRHHLNRITAMVPVNNKQATRFATLMGFKYEGELRKAFLWHGQYYNVALYGLLHDEFFKKEVIN